ncbi:MAG: hypothetical protein K2K84_07120 [Muribaculaceae bacterium]|nr:hypothetical protein [Muribaculaceae bacterium]
MKRIFLALLVAFCGISGSAQSTSFSSDKGGWGVSIFGDLKVENTPVMLAALGPGYTFYGPPFEQRRDMVYRQWSIGCSGFYTWYPLTNSKTAGLTHVFARFGLGGDFNRYGYNDQFLFNSEILLGYTFSFKNVSLDLYTGPKGKFAPNRRSYTGPYGMVSVYPDEYPNDVSQLPVYTTRMYTGGAYWSFGATLKIQHVGINLSYNQGISDFEYYSSPDLKYLPANPRALNTMTVGLQYYF